METIMFLSTTGLQVVQGSTSGSKLHIDHFQEYLFQEGTMLDGVIMDENSIIDFLKNAKTKGADSTRLVVDSGQIFIKASIAPKLNNKELKQFVRNEFVDVDTFESELLYDYTVIVDKLEDRDGQLVLCAAMEREFIDPYIHLFDEAGITLESIDLLTNSVIKLTESMINLDHKTYVLSYINGNDINNYLFIDGHYAMTNRVRIFSDRGSVSFVTEVTNTLTKLIQFFKGAYKDHTIEQLYFAGLDEYEEEMLFSAVETNLGMKTSRFTLSSVQVQADKDFPLHKFLAVGSMWRR